MRIRSFVAGSIAALALSAAVLGQSAPSDIDVHMAAAKVAAGLDFRGTFMNLCLPGGLPGVARGAGPARGGAAPARGGGGRGAAPDRSTWYASPYKVFDNFYWLGTRQHSSW